MAAECCSTASGSGMRNGGALAVLICIVRTRRCGVRRGALGDAASSDARPTKGRSPLDSSTLETTPVGRAPPDARVPGFAAEPKPAQRRAMLDPRRGARHWIHRRWKQPRVGRASPDARVPGSEAEPKPAQRRAMLDPRRGARHWIHRRWKQPRVGRAPPDARVPGFAAEPKPAQRRAMLDPRTASPLEASTLETTPWVGLRPTPAFLDSQLSPSPRSVERCSTHGGALATGFIDAGNNPVGRASPDARVPGFGAEPKPSQRRAMLDPRRSSPPDSSPLKTTPRGSGFARRPRSWIRR